MSSQSSRPYDVFVSYAHKDNLETSWARVFVEALATKAGSLLARDLRYFFDEQIEVGTDVPPQLLDAAGSTRILLLLLSPRYLASPWCQSELRSFLERRQTTNRNIFVIEVERVDRERWPRALRGMETVAMWEEDAKSRQPLRHDPKLGSDAQASFYRGAYEIAHMVAERLDVAADVPPPAPKGAVWLSEATDDLVRYRENLAGRIRQAGWEVLPRSSHYSRHDAGVYANELQADLAEAKLYVQILGPWGGSSPTWSLLPYPVLQANAARDAAAKHKVRWLRWRTKEAAATTDSDDYRTLVHEGGVQESTPGEFDTEVDRVLKLLSEPPPPPSVCPAIVTANADTPVIVYVHSDEVDRALAGDIQSSLLTLRVDSIATPPPAEQVPSAMRKGQWQPLEFCDGVILVYGRTTATWVSSQFGHLRKAFSKVRRDGTIGVLSGPPPPKPMPIASPAVLAIDCMDGLNVDVLANFVARLRSQNNGGNDDA
jgi:TIR domain